MAEKRGRMKKPLPLAVLLEAVFAGKPAERRLRESRIWQVWAEAVGSQIAGKARPASFRDGTLTVRVTGSAWLQQLSLLKSEIISQLNGAIGEPLVSDIYFKQGSLSVPSEDQPQVRHRQRVLTAAEKQRLAELAAPVADPELRAVLMALCASQLADETRKSSP
jgi:hypothetical protein